MIATAQIISQLRKDADFIDRDTYDGCWEVKETARGKLLRQAADRLAELAEIGYDAQWDCVSASSLGLPHKRERLIIIAYPQCSGRARSLSDRNIFVRAFEAFAKHGDAVADSWAALVRSEPVLRERDGLSLTMERRRLFQCGNAVVPHKIEAIGRAILEARGLAA